MAFDGETAGLENPVLTFIIPVRHPENARDWSLLRENLGCTARSIAAQSDSRWHAVVVANRGSDLPALPARFTTRWVDLPPNPIHEQGTADLDTFRVAVRHDKGSRIATGLTAISGGHVMVVDDDDFVSRRLTAFVAGFPDANGWFVRDGYLWGHGGRFTARYRDFSDLCGTSLIVRSDLYDTALRQRAASSADFTQRMLGSHIFLKPELAASGYPLAPLPFPGAVYRVGHAGAHSRSKTLLRQFVLRRDVLRDPIETTRRLLRIRPLSPQFRHEFFGAAATSAPDPTRV